MKITPLSINHFFNKKKSMKQQKAIGSVQLAFNCPQDWDSMTVCNGGRFCNGCQKIVYDFTDKSQKDYEAMLRQHDGKLCGRFLPQQMKPSSSYLKAAALIALSFAVADGKTQTPDSIFVPPPPPPAMGEPISSNENIDSKGGIFFGVVEKSPEFEGGAKARQQFINDNLKYPEALMNSAIEGTVYISFIVEIDGTLTDVTIRRGIGGGLNEEAVRVVNLMSGKWRCGKQSGKPVRSAYTIPIKFRLE